MTTETMTVSAALRRIKKIKGLIAERTTRANAAVVFVEGKEPGFEFAAAVEARGNFVKDLIAVQAAVAVTNATAKLSNGKPVAYAIRVLEELKAEIDFYKKMPVRATTRETETEENWEWNPNMTSRSKTETSKVWISKLSQAQRAERVEKLTSEFEKLNNEVEASNNHLTIEVSLSS